jgi:hypothetical protein
MTLSPYHQRYAAEPDAKIAARLEVKDKELATVFAAAGKPPDRFEPARVAVLGCGERRLVLGHRRIFEQLLGRPAKVMTYDITLEHLEGEEDVTLHDVTKPLPNPPYDITYGHVVMKFIETAKQWELIRNSFNALTPGGLAIHVLDRGEVEATTVMLPDGYYAVPLQRWTAALTKAGAHFQTVPLEHGMALVITRQK